MKDLVLIFLAVQWLHHSCIYSTEGPQDIQIDSLVNTHALQLMNDSSMMGLSLGIYFDEKSYFFNYGSIEKGLQISPTEYTVYEIGSITKTFTGILLAHAVTEGRIHLHDEISKYLEGDFDNLLHNGVPIQIIHLANHSSGLPEDLIPIEFDTLKNPTMFDIIDIYKDDRGSMFWRDLQSAMLDFEPGHQIQYSNAGMILLGIILEKVYDTPYSDLISRYFSQPFDMRNTETVNFISNQEDYTKGYDKNGNVMPHITFQIAGAAGGLKSTTHDMVKYLVRNISSEHEAVKLSQQSTIEKNGKEMGLGWQIRTTSMGDKVLWHVGGEPGFSSYISILPEENLGIICMTNQRSRQSQLAVLSENIISDLINK